MKLSESSKVWIYGYSLRGRLITDRLAQEGIKIYGYLDRSPEQYIQAQKKVLIMRPDEVTPSPNDVVICSVSNVFHHREIAERLSSKGFLYIIHKNFQGSPAGKRIDALYDNITSIFQDLSIKEQEIPLYTDVAMTEGQAASKADTVCVNIPVELLFGITVTQAKTLLLGKSGNLLEEISGKSLLYYRPSLKMMQYFAGSVDEASWKRCRELWFACRNTVSFASPSEESYSKERK